MMRSFACTCEDDSWAALQLPYAQIDKSRAKLLWIEQAVRERALI